jgi:hypothetical protein
MSVLVPPYTSALPAQPPLTVAQINVVMQAATILMLGLTPPATTGPDSAYSAVRIDWQQQGQPSHGITDDVTYIGCVRSNDQYDRVLDEYYVQDNFTKVKAGTRVWEIRWSVYGPNSDKNSELLSWRLFDQDVANLLAAAQLYWVTDAAPPMRIPEEKGTGQWWERWDFSARFNEFAQVSTTAQSVVSAEVIGIANGVGEIFDVDVVGAFPPTVPISTVVASNGALSSAATVATSLLLTASEVIQVIVNSQTYAGVLGGCSLTTGALSSGSITAGGSFADGGTFLLNFTVGDLTIQYVATMTGLIWSESTLSNGQIYYTLSGTLQSTQGSGSFQLQTATIGTVPWSGTAVVQLIDINLL